MIRPSGVEIDENFLASVVPDLEALVGPGVFFACLALGARLDQDFVRFGVETPEQFGQVEWRHGQLEALAIIVCGPADVRQQAEVFSELQGEALSGGVAPASPERNP